MTHNTGANDPARYKQLAAEIRGWLDAGMFRPGEALPSITDLAADRGCARETCGRAVRVLVAEGRVTFYPGRGYYVSEPPSEVRA